MSDHLHKVRRCSGCPFYQSEWSVCTKTAAAVPGSYTPQHRGVPYPENMGPPPAWCLLRQGGVLVVLDPTTGDPT